MNESLFHCALTGAPILQEDFAYVAVCKRPRSAYSFSRCIDVITPFVCMRRGADSFYLDRSELCASQEVLSPIVIGIALGLSPDDEFVIYDTVSTTVESKYLIVISKSAYEAATTQIGFKNEKPPTYKDRPPFYIHLLAYIKHANSQFTLRSFQELLKELHYNTRELASGCNLPGMHIILELLENVVSDNFKSYVDMNFKVDFDDTTKEFVVSKVGLTGSSVSAKASAEEQSVFRVVTRVAAYVLAAEIARDFPSYYLALQPSLYGPACTNNLQVLRNKTYSMGRGDALDASKALYVAKVICTDTSKLHAISLHLVWQDIWEAGEGQVELCSHPVRKETVDYLVKNYSNTIQDLNIQFFKYESLAF